MFDLRQPGVGLLSIEPKASENSSLASSHSSSSVCGPSCASFASRSSRSSRSHSASIS